MSVPRALWIDDDEFRIDMPPEIRARTAPDGVDADCLDVYSEG